MLMKTQIKMEIGIAAEHPVYTRHILISWNFMQLQTLISIRGDSVRLSGELWNGSPITGMVAI